jgi:RNA polymerase sigma-70 factor (ECF subfamily)
MAVLVGRARAGDAAAFEALVRAHLRAAFAVALAVLGNAADAEDVAQDAFVAAFEQLDTCRNPDRFAGWLVQIVRNRALNALQSRRTAGAAAEQMARAVDPAGHGPERLLLRDRLVSALSLVTPAQREVVLLHDLDGWTHPEISQALGISEVMSRQHLFQARKVMRAHLGEEESKEVADGARK